MDLRRERPEGTERKRRKGSPKKMIFN